MVKPKYYFLWIFAGFLILVSGQSSASGVLLRYQAVPEKLYYESRIQLESLVHTGKVNVSTNLELTCKLENELTTYDNKLIASRLKDGMAEGDQSEQLDYLIYKLTFTDIQLDEYNRNVRVMDHDKRPVGVTQREQLERQLKEQLSYKWINLVLTEQGQVMERYHSTSLKEVSQLDLTRLAEYMAISLPEKELRIGDEWTGSYNSILPPQEEAKPFISIIRYTYLGTEEWKGIQSHKIRVFLTHQDEALLGTNDQGITRITQIVSGTIYIASTGGFLVYSNLSNDLAMLVLMGNQEQGGYRNFIHTRLDQTIELQSLDDELSD